MPDLLGNRGGMPNSVRNPLTAKYWYIKQLFEYTNKLIDRTEARANYLLVSNSVLAAVYVSLVSFMSNENNKIINIISRGPLYRICGVFSPPFSTIYTVIVFLPAVAFIVSVWRSVTTILPIILRHEIKLNQSYISKFTPQDYVDFIAARHDNELRSDFVEEIHILSTILQIKTRRVNQAAWIFAFGLTILIPCLAAYSITIACGRT
jgi:Family of unknown function (DUF5706)